MNYIFVWQKTGEHRMPRFGEWYVHPIPPLCNIGPFQYNGKYRVGKFEIVVRRPVDSRKGYTENAIIEKGVTL